MATILITSFVAVLGLALSTLTASVALAGGSNKAANGKDQVQSSAPAKMVDPPLPPGRDPGGIAVNWVGEGLDYTADHIRSRLTRDGEGELTGFDFADDDRRPFAPGPSSELNAAGLFLGESQTGTLVVLRTARDDPKSLFTAIGYGLRTPARMTVILNDTSAPDTVAALRDAALHFPAHLFVTRPVTIGVDAKVPANLIRVAAAGATPAPTATDSDVSVPVEMPTQPGRAANHAAQSRIAALAVRLLAVEPGIDAAAVKARIIALANVADAAQSSATVPLISDPRRHFWLE